MKLKLIAICPLLSALCISASAQGTAFTYQGRLDNDGSPAPNGLYDFTNALYTVSSGGAATAVNLAGPLTAVPVTNGLFTVLLDFGSVFNGTPYYLQIGVRSNATGSYVALSPRQELTPTPYAITAENVDGLVSASQLTGTLPSGLLSGAYGDAVTLNNAGNSFTGNGSGLTSLNASQLTSGTVADAELTANVALLNRTPQTFTGNNTFSRNATGPGLMVSGFNSIDTTLFTGLGFQYYATSGEGAIMSSYNDGFGFLSFYTKQGNGSPIAQQMVISKFGDIQIDQQNANNGVINNGTTNGAGLTFGNGSGEGIASKRTAGGNQNGLDFYTSFTPRVSIANNGWVGIGTQSDITGSDIFTVHSPSGAGSYGGMYVDTAGATGLPFYGYSLNGSSVAWTYLDGSDGNKWKLFNSGTWLTVTPAGTVGIGTTTPGATLDVRGNVKLGTNGQYFATGGAENLRIVRGIVNTSGGIYNGTGFTITHTSTGNYTITFSPAFADAPSLTITAYTAGSPVTANCTGGTPSGYSVTTWVGTTQADSWWNFVAIGAR